jgi:hypothetical protein
MRSGNPSSSVTGPCCARTAAIAVRGVGVEAAGGKCRQSLLLETPDRELDRGVLVCACCDRAAEQAMLSVAMSGDGGRSW